METKQAEISIEKTIEYFDNLQTNIATTTEALFKGAFINRLEKFLDGNAKATTKAVIKDFLRRCSTDFIVEAFRGAMGEACAKTTKYLREAKQNIMHLEDLNEEIYILEETARQRKEEVEQLRELFPDPKARSAYELYKRISACDAREDSYTKQARIRQAGLVAASFLGLQRYEINPVNKQNQD